MSADRPGGLPHKKSLHHSGGGKTSGADHRQECRRGTQGCVLQTNWCCGKPTRADTAVRPYKRRDWVEESAVGKGGQGRQECRPQAWRPAPQQCRLSPGRRSLGAVL